MTDEAEIEQAKREIADMVANPQGRSTRELSDAIEALIDLKIASALDAVGDRLLLKLREAEIHGR